MDVFADVWTHGDFITIHPATKQVIFSGRSDGVLNPSGIRFGSAEIYNVLETQFAAEVMESVCVGQRRPQDLDESVFLFVQMQPDRKFTEALVQRIRDAIRKSLSPRHVPRYIFETPGIPVRPFSPLYCSQAVANMCRPLSPAKRSNFQSNTLYPADGSNHQAHWPILKVWISTTNSPK